MNYTYDNTAQRWRNVANGQFVSEQAVVAEMRVHQEATFSTLDTLTNQLYSGQLTVQQWQVSVASELKDAHLAQAMFGAGGSANMNASKWGRVGGTLASEYRFLDNFANDIANGNVSEAQALARIRQYGRATQQSYWREWEHARTGSLVNWNVNPGENCGGCLDMQANNPHVASELDKHPGSGDTPCRGNCNCTLSAA